MIFIENKCTDPYYNLALEQYIFEAMSPAHSYFMLWQNRNAIIIGKYQNAYEEINAQYVQEHDIKVVRRLSGGGAVYHDLGNINFSFITDERDTDGLDMKRFCTPVVKALAALGIQAEISGRNDITIEGRKFSGNSQYTRNGRVMHHGTIIFDSDLDVLTRALNVPPDKIESKSIKSVRSRVTCVREHLPFDCSLGEFWDALKTQIMAENQAVRYELSGNDIEAVQKLAAERYATWEWNYGMSPAFSIVKERRIAGCGKISIGMNVERGRITAFDSCGDYFGNKDCNDVRRALLGCKTDRDSVLKALQVLNIGDYYYRLTAEELTELILQ